MSYRGDVHLGDTIDIKFCTVQSTGAPTTLAGSPVISAYVDNGTTEITAGITLTVDFDSRTGLNNVRVVASSGNGFAAGTNIDLVITTGTVNSVSAVGYVVASFSIDKRPVNVTSFGGTAGTFAAGRPEVNTTHIGGTISPAVAGKVGIDFAQVNEPAAGTFPTTGIIDMGTAQSVPDSTHLQIRAAAAFADHELKGATLLITSATTGALQRVLIDDNVGATDTVSFGALPTALTGTVTYRIFGTPPASSASPAAVNVTQILGTAVSTPATAGILDVNVKNIDNDLASASGTVTFPNATLASTTNITAGTITTATNVTTVNGLAANVITAAAIASGAFSAAKFAADTGIPPIRSGTAQSGSTATTIKLDAGASAQDGFYNNQLIEITGGTGGIQARFITAYVGSTKVATVASWVVTPDNTSTFAILPFDAVAGATAPTVAQIVTGVYQALTSSGDFTTAGSIGKLFVDMLNAAIGSRMATYVQPGGFLATTFPGGTVASATNVAGVQSDTDDIQSRLTTVQADTDDIQTRLTTLQADTDDIQARLPAALVSGRMDASIGAAAANTLTASALATDAVTEIVAAVFARAFGAALQGKTFEQIIGAIVAMLAGPTTGADTNTEVFKTPDGTVAVTVTNDGDNRTTTTIA